MKQYKIPPAAFIEYIGRNGEKWLYSTFLKITFSTHSLLKYMKHVSLSIQYDVSLTYVKIQFLLNGPWVSRPEFMFCNAISDKCAELDTPPPFQDMCPHFCPGVGGSKYFVSMGYTKKLYMLSFS